MLLSCAYCACLSDFLFVFCEVTSHFVPIIVFHRLALERTRYRFVFENKNETFFVSYGNGSTITGLSWKPVGLNSIRPVKHLHE